MGFCIAMVDRCINQVKRLAYELKRFTLLCCEDSSLPRVTCFKLKKMMREMPDDQRVELSFEEEYEND